jgi:hypothetical protein
MRRNPYHNTSICTQKTSGNISKPTRTLVEEKRRLKKKRSTTSVKTMYSYDDTILSSICISGFLNIVVLGLRGETVLLGVYSCCCFLDLGLRIVVISSSVILVVRSSIMEISVNPLEHWWRKREG